MIWNGPAMDLDWGLTKRTTIFFQGGWLEGQSYRFKLLHRPKTGLIRLKLWEGETQIADSGDIFDNGPESLKGGRLGVYCDSQEQITWSALNYK